MTPEKPRSAQALAADEWGQAWRIGVACGVVIGIAAALAFGRMA